MKTKLLLPALFLSNLFCYGQVGIGTAVPHNSAQLEIASSSKGLLVPRLTKAQRDAIPLPLAQGLLIYQTETPAGFYYWESGKWQPLGNGWQLEGNEGTISSHFLGTTDGQPLRFKVNNQLAGYISPSNNLTSFGYGALGLLGGSESVAIGTRALAKNGAIENTAIGPYALESNTTGYSNTAVGHKALQKNETGFSNTAVGQGAMASNVESSHNTAVGFQSIQANSTGARNTATGSFTLSENKTGNDNAGFGYNALHSNTTGKNNAAFGANSLTVSQAGNNNTAIGAESLIFFASGSDNTALGYKAMNQTLSADANTAVGSGTLFSLGAKVNNVVYNAVGNTAVGTGADIPVAQNSDYNILLGAASKINGPDARYNIAIGYQSNVESSLQNAIAIGYGAKVSSSNTIQLGNNSITQVITAGNIVAANVGAPSDQRFKYQIHEDVKGLDFIMALKPVTYLFDNQKLADFRDGKLKAYQLNADVLPVAFRPQESQRKTGFLAQQVVQAAKSVGYDFDGVSVPKNENDIYTVSYSSFVVPLVKAVQEQQHEIEALKQAVKLLAEQNQKLMNERKQMKGKAMRSLNVSKSRKA